MFGFFRAVGPFGRGSGTRRVSSPSLAYVQGVWLRAPLPHFSITHSGGRAFVALVSSECNVGLDAEPLERTLSENAYDMMAKSSELAALRSSPEHVFQAWTGKEAVQKCLGKGMHLNPREIVIPTGKGNHEIHIENSKIQLEYWQDEGYHLSLATTPAPPSLSLSQPLRSGCWRTPVEPWRKTQPGAWAAKPREAGLD